MSAEGARRLSSRHKQFRIKLGTIVSLMVSHRDGSMPAASTMENSK